MQINQTSPIAPILSPKQKEPQKMKEVLDSAQLRLEERKRSPSPSPKYFTPPAKEEAVKESAPIV
jgi:hypothetical protein